MLHKSRAGNPRRIYAGHMSLDRYPTYVRTMSAKNLSMKQTYIYPYLYREMFGGHCAVIVRTYVGYLSWDIYPSWVFSSGAAAAGGAEIKPVLDTEQSVDNNFLNKL